MRHLAAIILLLVQSWILWANPYSGPVSLVVIDAGHGGRDPGAVSGRLEEKDLTLSISLELERELEARGYEVYMTRDGDVFLELQERCDAANSQDFDISGYPVFISIHINSSAGGDASGFEVYVRQTERDVAFLSAATSDTLALKYSSYTNRQLNAYEARVSSELAEAICRNFSQEFPRVPMRGVKSGDLWVLNGTWMPSVLVEAGFISNDEEADRMASDSFQKQLAVVIADALQEL